MDDSGWRREKREGRNELVPPVVVMVVVAVFVEERSWDYTRLRYDTILTLPFLTDKRFLFLLFTSCCCRFTLFTFFLRCFDKFQVPFLHFPFFCFFNLFQMSSFDTNSQPRCLFFSKSVFVLFFKSVPPFLTPFSFLEYTFFVAFFLISVCLAFCPFPNPFFVHCGSPLPPLHNRICVSLPPMYSYLIFVERMVFF